MKRVGIVLASILACLSLAVPAPAQTGNGLYEPFPSGAPSKRAKRFVQKLSSRPAPFGSRGPTDAELERGVSVDPSLRPGRLPKRRASSRAAGGGFAPSLGWPLGAVLLAAAAAPALALRARRS